MNELDRIESKTRLEEISELINEGRKQDAADLLDGVNWAKVQNVSSLLSAADMYEKIAKYEEARNLLEIAHERSPIGRMIIFKLAIASIRLNDLDNAQVYYDEFLEVAPHDSLKHILNFELSKAKGERDEVLITILEELKEADFSEEWAFELACLYHKAGQVDKCIFLCDEIILWFGEGPYVEKALEMKMLYRPLDKQQEDKYRRFKSADSAITEIRPSEFSGTGEILSHTIRIPEIDIKASEKFNTTNLQAEIKKNIEEIMQASEMGEVADNMDTIKGLVEDIPYLNLVEEKKDEHSLKKSDTQKIGELVRDRYQKYLSEEFDGQMSFYMPEEHPVESQVDGQMTIEEVMAEWEKTKRAAEATLSDAKEMELLQYKQRAIEEASLLLDRLIEVSPKLDAGVTPAQLLEEEYLSKNEDEDTKNDPVKSQKTFSIPKIAPEGTPEGAWEIPVISAEEAEHPETIEGMTEREEKLEDELIENPKDWEPPVLEDLIADVNNIMQEKIDEIEAEKRAELEAEKEKEKEVEPEDKEENKNEEEADVDLEDTIISAFEQEEDAVKIQKSLTDFEKEILSYFGYIKSMESSLCQSLTGLRERLNSGRKISAGHVVIIGRRGSGKTKLATDIIKILKEEIGKPAGPIGKISGSKLNEKDQKQLFEKIRGGALIIEEAGALEKDTIVSLTLMMEHDNSGILVILEDTKPQIEKVFNTDARFAKKFTEKITIPIMTIDELVNFAKVYAADNGYAIDEMGVLALYDRVNLSQQSDRPTCIIDVKDMVDDAIANQKIGKKGLFGLFGSKAVVEDGRPVLQEKDFQKD